MTVAVGEVASKLALPSGSPGGKEGKDPRALDENFMLEGGEPL